jgi:hypothetical protein
MAEMERQHAELTSELCKCLARVQVLEALVQELQVRLVEHAEKP